MSQMVTRKGVSSDEKEKRHTDSPVKDMKKKTAPGAEKEKVVDKPADKQAEKAEKPTEKKGEKTEKPAEKKTETNGPVAEKGDKKDTKTDKKEAGKKDVQEKKDGQEKKDEGKGEKIEKVLVICLEKKDSQEKKDESKADKGGKPDKDAKPKEKPKQNPSKAHNGVSDVTLSAAREPSANGDAASEEEGVLVIDSEGESERDELFPELAYEDEFDNDEFDNEVGVNRSITRRSQSKDKDKILKMKDDATSTDRKLRSSDTPKQEQKKQDKPQETGKKPEGTPKKADTPKKGEGDEKGDGGEKKSEMEVVIEIDNDGPEESRKPDTNYSKSRVKVSPYRRSARLADQTTSSVMANYTGNNTTMEMDITETSSFVSEEASLDDSSYLSGLRSIRGRRSYKPLRELTLRHVPSTSLKTTSVGTETTRPTAPVVGRKRKPDTESFVEVATEVNESSERPIVPSSAAQAKRMRLLDRIAMPFRKTAVSTPLPARRNAVIVGINTDLPLTAPVSIPETIDPESLKTPLSTSSPVSLAHPEADRDGKRCVVM